MGPERNFAAGTSIRYGPEGAQGVLEYAALSLSLSFSSVSLSSIFDLIVFPAPFGKVPLWAFSFFVSIFVSNVLRHLFISFFDECSSFG